MPHVPASPSAMTSPPPPVGDGASQPSNIPATSPSPPPFPNPLPNLNLPPSSSIPSGAASSVPQKVQPLHSFPTQRRPKRIPKLHQRELPPNFPPLIHRKNRGRTTSKLPLRWLPKPLGRGVIYSMVHLWSLTRLL
ncbi:hypothetical protein QJS10_CPA07g00930 [Acorus calamus]|uniref:Uncharacterized protein n=1 Tax=Acorus calamus TaxID=4465 RepID=A0AAV9EJS9_ACOCL|nr:hypothetical protein QJS10_CPA07g00930 [Acorus calamus]